MREVKVGVSLYDGVPPAVYSIVRQRGIPAGKASGEFQRYYMPLQYVERIQAIMQAEVGAQDVPLQRRWT